LSERKKILVIGATGHFGGRICRRLLGEPGAELLVASRDAAAVDALAVELQANASDMVVSSTSLDQSHSHFEQDLRHIAPDIVIHTAGPYQGQDYRVAEACLQCGSHYIDLADGRDFVAGFDQFDEAAKRQNILMVSGASTLPGLSSCVIEALRDRFDTLHGVEISIAPGHQTPRGAGTVSAVLSYCGKPFQVLVNGHWVTMHGWQNLRLQRYPALGRRLSGACDVPDLSLLPTSMPELKTVTFHAALEAWWEQVALWSMAWLSRLHVISDWQRFVPAFRRMSHRLMAFGSDKGGMQMSLSGMGQNGTALSLQWQLTAGQNHGPEIPCTPALILARKLLRETETRRGAFACMNLINLSEFDVEVSDLDIDWRIDEER
jgi:saccharopine dehydrogenase-like NADP-dependent oxidoreductase